VDDSWCLKFDDCDIMKSWKGFSITTEDIETRFQLLTSTSISDNKGLPSKKRKIESDIDASIRTIILDPIKGLNSEHIDFLLRYAYEELFGPLPKNAIQQVLISETSASVRLSNDSIANIFVKASKKMRIDG